MPVVVPNDSVSPTLCDVPVPCDWLCPVEIPSVLVVPFDVV